MSVIYDTATKTARMNAVVSAIGASGKLELLSAADAVLATLTLAATAGTVSGGVLTFADANGATAGILNTTASAAGTITKARVTTAGGSVIISGLTVATSGADMTIDNATVSVGQPVTVSSATITHA